MSYKVLLKFNSIVTNWRMATRINSYKERESFWKIWDTLNVDEKNNPIVLKIMMRYI
jgi:hypothetical protein